ncbi:hypothetical protein J1N35_004554 [Gossypium stocksii]|uniref:Uncharacterized protein n=1 Tax=Gossypium stocksii TaxID=47602 RepID=A0A9D3WB78_9ROSI|nr:hypothetical protein J1N35_004554 [Gossypium stocksii]
MISSEEDTDSGKLELHCKKKADYIGTFAVMITASPSVNLQTAAHESFLVTTRSNSAPPSIPHFTVPPSKELPIGNSSESAPSHRNLSSLDLTIVSVGDNTTDLPTTNNIDVVEGNERGDIGREECKGRENDVLDDQTKT